jgi:hypothetical protein
MIFQLFKNFSACTELHGQKLAPLDLILSYLNPRHALNSYFSKTSFKHYFPNFVYVDQSQSLFLKMFRPKFCSLLPLPVSVLLTDIITVQKCKLCILSLGLLKGGFVFNTADILLILLLYQLNDRTEEAFPFMIYTKPFTFNYF